MDLPLPLLFVDPSELVHRLSGPLVGAHSLRFFLDSFCCLLILPPLSSTGAFSTPTFYNCGCSCPAADYRSVGSCFQRHGRGSAAFLPFPLQVVCPCFSFHLSLDLFPPLFGQVTFSVVQLVFRLFRIPRDTMILVLGLSLPYFIDALRPTHCLLAFALISSPVRPWCVCGIVISQTPNCCCVLSLCLVALCGYL